MKNMLTDETRSQREKLNKVFEKSLKRSVFWE